MKIKSLMNFSGGYNVDEHYEARPANEGIRAENCYWKNGIEQRGGHQPYATGTFAASDVVRGASKRYYINSTWVHILAIDLNASSEVRFYYQTTTSITVVDAGYAFTTGNNVIFAELDGHIVAVNGVDKPAVIFYDGSWQVENLEAHDVRTRSNATWNAGQFTNTGPVWTDDTTDAQDAGADDFQLASTTNNDGFFIACTHTFNKVILKSAQQFDGAPVAEYRYYTDAGGWGTPSMVSSPTWTAAAGDRTIEFNIPTDIGRYDGSETVLANRFVLRVRFTTAPTTAKSCDYAQVYHTQFITEMTDGDKPHFVISHNSRMWLFVGYIVYYSPPNGVTGWRGLSESEYFLEGGPEVRSALSHKGYLLIFKDHALYAFYGNSLESFLRKKLSDVGIEEILSVVSTDEEAFRYAIDGTRSFNGARDLRVSKHIKTDLDGWTRTGATSTFYQGEVYLSFPSEDIVLWFDPSTLREDPDTGDGKVSFFKFTSYQVDYFINCDGPGDIGMLLGVVNDTTPYVAKLETGTNDKNRAGTDTNIKFRLQTSYMAFGNYLREKVYGLMKIKMKEETSKTYYIITLRADEGERSETSRVEIPIGSNHYTKDFRIPSTIDGHDLSIDIQNNELQDAGIRGITLEYDLKEF